VDGVVAFIVFDGKDLGYPFESCEVDGFCFFFEFVEFCEFDLFFWFEGDRFFEFFDFEAFEVFFEFGEDVSWFDVKLFEPFFVEFYFDGVFRDVNRNFIYDICEFGFFDFYCYFSDHVEGFGVFGFEWELHNRCAWILSSVKDFDESHEADSNVHFCYACEVEGADGHLGAGFSKTFCCYYSNGLSW